MSLNDLTSGNFKFVPANNANGASYASFRGAGKWPGYRHTVEHTIHVDQDHWGQGLGRMLLEALRHNLARVRGLAPDSKVMATSSRR